MLSFNYYIWKMLFDRKLRTSKEIEKARNLGILTQDECDSILTHQNDDVQ
ncbi:hypothetical protein [Bacillus chungangensis]|uniref:XkdX family protein n=1 Tax=Bacillus chungangensis TaxID=587633 RepID=A0ABT9WRX8_9BACI|nr:hypothetical protein [Bacillus chungangensis]MDQ0175970.1 hypothetical protein [Bacillus chungangensis]